MSNNDEPIIDAEIVESDNLPAVIETHERSEPITKWSEEWWANASPEVRAHRCRAHSSRTGEPCKNASVSGATVCRFHGGTAKHVKAAARTRLDNAADLMARNLLRLAVGADSEQVNLGATNSALDRAGISKPTEVVLSQGEQAPWEQVFDGIAGGSREESRARRGLPPENESLSETLAFNAGYESDREQMPFTPPAVADDAGYGDHASETASRRAAVRHVTGMEAIERASEARDLPGGHRIYKIP